MLELQKLKGNIYDEIETCSGMQTMAKLNKTYDKVDSDRSIGPFIFKLKLKTYLRQIIISVLEKNIEEIDNLKRNLGKLEEDKLIISTKYLKSQMDFDTLKREQDDILRDNLIQKVKFKVNINY